MATSETIRDIESAKVQRIEVEDLGQHLDTLEQELAESKTIELIRGGAVIAELRAPLKNTNATSGRVIPDFMGQMREVFGDQVFPLGTGLKWINEGRGK